MTVTDASIVAQVAAKIAGDLAASGTIPVSDMQSVQTDIFEHTIALTGLTAAEFVKQEAPKKQWNNGGGNQRSNGGSSRSGGGSGSRDEDPGTIEFRGGKAAGKTIAQVYAMDEVGDTGYAGPDYLKWYAENANNDFMVKRVERFLANVA